MLIRRRRSRVPVVVDVLHRLGVCVERHNALSIALPRLLFRIKLRVSESKPTIH